MNPNDHYIYFDRYKMRFSELIPVKQTKMVAIPFGKGFLIKLKSGKDQVQNIGPIGKKQLKKMFMEEMDKVPQDNDKKELKALFDEMAKEIDEAAKKQDLDDLPVEDEWEWF